MVVHRQHGIDAGQLQHLCVQFGGERLTVEFLQVCFVALVNSFAEIGGRAAILRAVVQVRFHQHDVGCAVFLGGARDEQIAHGQVLAADNAA